MVGQTVGAANIQTFQTLFGGFWKIFLCRHCFFAKKIKRDSNQYPRQSNIPAFTGSQNKLIAPIKGILS